MTKVKETCLPLGLLVYGSGGREGKLKDRRMKRGVQLTNIDNGEKY